MTDSIVAKPISLEVRHSLYTDPSARAWLDQHHCEFTVSMINTLEITVPDRSTLILFMLCYGEYLLSTAAS